MVQIVLTAEQTAAIVAAGHRFELVDQDGNRVAVAEPLFTAEEIAAALAARESEDPRRTTAEVLARMRADAVP